MNHIFKLLIFTLIGTLVFLSCSSSTDSNEDEEFKATLDDFAGYTSWTLVASKTGPDPFLASAHGVNDSFTRNIYFKDNASASNGAYGKGALLVKELRDAENNLAGALTMMAKRGGGFNPDGDGWEWFMAATDLSEVLTQGDNAAAAGGACAGCHAQANAGSNGIDWVFSKKE